MGKPKNNLVNNQTKNKIMKFDDHLFTLFINGPLKADYDYLLYEEYLLFLDVYYFVFFILMGFNYCSNENIFLRLSGSIGLIIIDILMFYLYKLYFTCHFYKFQDSRIDFIYSYNFERLFIGIVNYSGKSYSHTFEYQIGELEQFLFEKPNNKSNSYNLNVLFKNNKKKETIYHFKKLDNNIQEGLEYFLNEKVNNHKGVDIFTPSVI